ncbi:MAG: hypothetical protein QMD12_03540 [Candidatus Aenigmarchaeota archaeon]|nr:hypothetical protein [Candidatus Aenigmarchaeota archaeon]
MVPKIKFSIEDRDVPNVLIEIFSISETSLPEDPLMTLKKVFHPKPLEYSAAIFLILI